MLAILFAMTSRLSCWALIPVAAMARAFIGQTPSPSALDRHAADFEIGGHDLVADGDRRLERLLGCHHRVDNLPDLGVAPQRLDRQLFSVLQLSDGSSQRLAKHATEVFFATAGRSHADRRRSVVSEAGDRDRAYGAERRNHC